MYYPALNSFLKYAVIITLLIVIIFYYKRSIVETEKSVKLGMPAPDFSLQDQDGIWRSLEDPLFKNKKIALYFYPKDFSPGCTKQACNLRDYHEQLKEAGITIIGISFDTPEQHKKFKLDHALPFILLADTTKSIAKKYGALWDLIIFSLPQRKTFLLNEEHRVIALLDTISVEHHAQEIIHYFTGEKKSAEEKK